MATTDFSQTALTLEEDRYTHDREYSMHPCSEKLHILPHEEEWRYPIYGVLSHGVRNSHNRSSIHNRSFPSQQDFVTTRSAP